uniref:Uncharacterized protein n=1 Tax=Fagus sylvatica TaxID=28930 RepID=A0A2N9FMM6_FAGSY
MRCGGERNEVEERKGTQREVGVDDMPSPPREVMAAAMEDFVSVSIGNEIIAKAEERKKKKKKKRKERKGGHTVALGLAPSDWEQLTVALGGSQRRLFVALTGWLCG